MHAVSAPQSPPADSHGEPTLSRPSRLPLVPATPAQSLPCDPDLGPTPDPTSPPSRGEEGQS